MGASRMAKNDSKESASIATSRATERPIATRRNAMKELKMLTQISSKVEAIKETNKHSLSIIITVERRGT